MNEYRKVTRRDLETAVDKTAKETVKAVKAKSPVRKKGKLRGGKYAPGAYKKSWGSRMAYNTATGYGREVRNAKHYQLTHLLEHGHELRGWPAKYTSKTFVDPIPHIPSDDETEKLYTANLLKELSK